MITRIIIGQCSICGGPVLRILDPCSKETPARAKCQRCGALEAYGPVIQMNFEPAEYWDRRTRGCRPLLSF